jgi:PLP dependent protein
LYEINLCKHIELMDIAQNIEKVWQQIEAACARSKRDPNTVTLLAVSKTKPPEIVIEAVQYGLNLFGENRVQEAKAKISLCPKNLIWHLIGHLQSNKCRDAVRLFEMIQSVDSLSLAEEINKQASRIGKTMPILLEVNVAGESSKYGYAPQSVTQELEDINSLPNLEIHGLMAIPPWNPDPDSARPYFQQLRRLKQECEDILSAPLPHLSMGMTNDFQVAIEEGATMVRIGSAIFGERR